MTFPQLFTFARRWSWLVLLGMLLASVASYVVSSRSPRVYEATAKLLVAAGPGTVGGADYNQLLAAERVTRTYAELLRTRPVVEAALQTAGLDLSYDAALRFLDAKPVKDTQLLQLSARAIDPQVAARLANTWAEVFVQQVRDSHANQFAETKSALAKQIQELSTALASRTQQVDALRAQPPSATRDTELARAQTDLAQLQSSYTAASRSYQDILQAEARTTDLVAVAEPAIAASTPVEPRTQLIVLAAMLLGGLIAACVAVAAELLDDRLTSPERVRRWIGLEPLGSLGVMAGGSTELVSTLLRQASAPRTAQAAESFRALDAILQFLGRERPLRTLLVTSDQPGAG